MSAVDEAREALLDGPRSGHAFVDNVYALIATVRAEYEPLEMAASITLAAVNVTMPEVSPYGCPHSRRWLNGVLDDIRAALEQKP